MRRITILAATLPLLLAACGDIPTRDTAEPGQAAVPVEGSARGQYLALGTCAPCHGADFAGGVVAGEYHTPSLSVVRNYDAAQFDALLVSGIAADGDAVGQLMKTNSVESLSAADRTLVREYLTSYLEQ